jgi:ribose/xylose/arabinose/galactoside ABC-type transport system permease subunit
MGHIRGTVLQTSDVKDSGAASVAAPDTPSRLKRIGYSLKSPYFWANWTVLLALVVAVIVFWALSPDTFLSSYNISTILTAAAVPAILVIGQAFVVMTAGIDLSNAAIVTLSAVTFGAMFAAGQPLILCMALAIVAGVMAGVVNGVVIAQFKINDFIVTLGMLSLAQGVALVISNATPVQVISEPLATFALGKVGVFPYIMILAVVLLIIAQLVLTQTRFGTHVLATGGNTETARAMGVKTKAMKIAVYAISGGAAGIASIVLISRIGAAEPSMNTSLLLNSVAAVVLGGVSLFGGRGNIVGPFVGAILLTMIINGLIVAGVPQYYQFIAIGLIVMISAVLVRSAK